MILNALAGKPLTVRTWAERPGLAFRRRGRLSNYVRLSPLPQGRTEARPGNRAGLPSNLWRFESEGELNDQG